MTDAERKAALVEKVERALCQEKCAFYGEPPCWGLDPAEYVIEPWNPNGCDEPGCGALAHAALTVALEEAARLAKGYADAVKAHGHLATAPHSAAEQAANEIEAAIRALIPDGGSASSSS